MTLSRRKLRLSSIWLLIIHLAAMAQLEESVLVSQPSSGYRRLWWPRGVMQEQQSNPSSRRLEQASDLSARRQVVGLRGASMDRAVNWLEPDDNSSYYPSAGYNWHLEDKRQAPPTSAGLIVSPPSERILPMNSDLGPKLRQSLEKFNWNKVDRRPPPGDSKSPIERGDCQTMSSTILLSRDEVDKISGQLVRSCRGLVQVNKCEGSCLSSVEPSIKSPTGLRKDCYCCDEGSFRRIQVRLPECYSASALQTTIGGRIFSLDQNSFMDITIDEPVECRCRKCDSFV